MKTINIHGKPYVMVKDRLVQFHKDNPKGSVATELIELSDRFIFKAIVIPDIEIPERFFTGHAIEITGTSQINKTSALENAETSAIGRALGCFGIGVEESFASGDEVANAIYQQNNPQEDNYISTETKVGDMACPSCSEKVLDNRVASGDGYELKLAKNGTSNQPSFKCINDKCSGGKGGSSWASWKLDIGESGLVIIESAPKEPVDDIMIKDVLADKEPLAF